ncbi:hypothetical protein GEMRC1_012783 [Eukaryota sp. GEM-RC1]
MSSSPAKLRKASATADRLSLELELKHSDMNLRSREYTRKFNSKLASQSHHSASVAAERLRAEMDLRRAAMFHKVHNMIERESLDKQSIRKEEYLAELSKIEQRTIDEQQRQLRHLRSSIEQSREEKARLSALADKELDKVKHQLIKEVHQKRIQSLAHEIEHKEHDKKLQYQALEDQKNALRESLGIDQNLVSMITKLPVQSFDDEGKRKYQELTEEVRQMEELHAIKVAEIENQAQTPAERDHDSNSDDVKVQSLEDQVSEQRNIIREQLTKFNEQQQILWRLQEEHTRATSELKVLEKEKSRTEAGLHEMMDNVTNLTSEKHLLEKKLKTELKVIKSTLATRERQLEELKKQREKERERAELLNQKLEDKQRALLLAEQEKKRIKRFFKNGMGI